MWVSSYLEGLMYDYVYVCVLLFLKNVFYKCKNVDNVFKMKNFMLLCYFIC